MKTYPLQACFVVYYFLLSVPFSFATESQVSSVQEPVVIKKPNILVYLSDDHSQFDSSLYGNDNILTPGLEAIAEGGMTFDHAYVASPSCAPSRAAMLTGLMPAKNGAEGNHTYPHESTPSLVLSLKDQGYEVYAFGKVAHGKDVSRYGFDDSGIPGYRNANYLGLKQNVERFLKSHSRKSKKPVALFVGISNPHVPWPKKYSVKPEAVEFPPHHVDTPETRRHRAAYYQEIIKLDRLAGELDNLMETHWGKDYIYIHTSDHGSQWPFGKWTLYDYGTRVPFIVKWPGKIAKGVRSDAFISWVDLLPTLIDLVGGKVSSDIDGRSFSPVLLGQLKDHRDYIFTTHTGDVNMNIYPIRSVRTKEWKLIHNLYPDYAFTSHSDLLRNSMAGAYWSEWVDKANRGDVFARAIVDDYYSSPEYELYHIAEDKWERNNLAKDKRYAKTFTQLHSVLSQWMKEQGDTKVVLKAPRLLENRQDWHPDFYAERIRVDKRGKIRMK